jgi:RNA polymerase sigma factor (sigma-70 family)
MVLHQRLRRVPGPLPELTDGAEAGLEFAAVLRAHGAMLSRIAAAYESRAAQRKDLLQEMALALWRALPTVRDGAAIKAFVARVAHNRAVNHVLNERRAGQSTTLDEDIADPRACPESEAASGEDHAQLLAAVRRLPMNLRQVVTLALEDLSHGEIAGVLGITVNNVDVRLVAK